MVANVMTCSALALLLSMTSHASGDAWIVKEWTTANAGQERHHSIVIEQSPELVDSYCVARGHFDGSEFAFVAAAKSSSGKDSARLCERGQFPESYFYVDKRIDLSVAFRAITWVEIGLSMVSRRNLSGDAFWVTSRGQLRRLDYLPMNREPWSFVYCEHGDLISNSRCKVLSVSLTDEGAIASMSLSELVDD